MLNSLMKQIRKTSVFDWVLSLVLVIAIVALAMYVCNHPDRDTTDSETFFPSFGGSKRASYETFTDAEDTEDAGGAAGQPATQLGSPDQLNEVGANDVGCCLVYYDRCGHCQTFKPAWKRMCQQANGRTIKGKQIRMYETGNDVNESVWKSVSDRHGIQGYPTILVKIGGPGAQWKEYNGPRNGLGEFLMTQA